MLIIKFKQGFAIEFIPAATREFFIMKYGTPVRIMLLSAQVKKCQRARAREQVRPDQTDRRDDLS